MHQAYGFEMPVIGLFGPTKAYEWGPIGSRNASVQAKGGEMGSLDVKTVYETCLAQISV